MSSPAATDAVRCALIVPTLGRSPLLNECVRALRRSADAWGGTFVLRIIHQGTIALALPPEDLESVEIVHSEDRLGFTGACNLGIDSGREELCFLVNDDAIVDRDWLSVLVSAFDRHPQVAAAQGLNLNPQGHIDGAGIAWNHWWQALQVGQGQSPQTWLKRDDRPRPVFGVSATAAGYRRSTIDAVRLANGQVFDERLDTYYEDVDLAVRLRQAGAVAVCVPTARARHAGSLTAETLSSHRRIWTGSNRLLVVARLLGRRYWLALPRVLMRDALDVVRGQRSLALLVRSWCRALSRIGAFAHRGTATSTAAVVRELPTPSEAVRLEAEAMQGDELRSTGRNR